MKTFIKRDKNDIFNIPVLSILFKNARFLFVLRVIVTTIFLYSLYYGFVNQSKENIFTAAVFWGIFWSLFQVTTLSSFGRLFCGVCPHGFLGKYITKFGLKKEMPKWMKNKYIGIFLIVVGWWGIFYSIPGFWRGNLSTVAMFSGITILAIIIFYIYNDMSYCKYICPVGTLNSAFDKVAFTKLETYSNECKDCNTFECAEACHYNLKPFTFAKKNSIDDCSLCMACADSCESVKFKFTKPGGKLYGKFKGLSADVWTYILILASIPITMAFSHGLNMSNISHEMIWNKTAVFLGFPKLGGMFTFVYGILLTAAFAVLGLWLASKALKQTYKSTFTNLGYAYAPLFLLTSLGHTIEMFFIRGYNNIVDGFGQGFGFNLNVASIASRGDEWLHIFGALRWIGIAWALLLLYQRLKVIDVKNGRKIFAFCFASMLVIFFIAVNIYRSHVAETYGLKPRGHSMSKIKATGGFNEHFVIQNNDNNFNKKYSIE